MDNTGIEIEITDLKQSLERELTTLRKDMLETLTTVGAIAQTSRHGFAFAITYILLGLILWRVW